MRKRRGFTMVEMTLTAALTSIIIGVLASLYGFAVTRGAQTTSSFQVANQLSNILKSIEHTVWNAGDCVSISLSNGRTALKCLMPEEGVDRDADGWEEYFLATSVGAAGMEKFGEGKRVWYYLADATGNINNSGLFLWRAVRDDDNMPTTANIDQRWSNYYGGRFQHNLLEQFTVNVPGYGSTNWGSASITIRASSYSSDEKRATTGVTSSALQRVTLSRTIYWRNWKK
jgi:hypothetical protein